MVTVLSLCGVLTVLGAIIVALDVPSEAPGWLGLAYLIGGVGSSFLWFALATILARVNDIEKTLRHSLTGLDSQGKGTPKGEPNKTYMLSTDYFESAEDYVNSRVAERSAVIRSYSTLREAVEGEWRHLRAASDGRDTPHLSVDEAKDYASSHGLRKASIYAVTVDQLRESISRLDLHKE